MAVKKKYKYVGIIGVTLLAGLVIASGYMGTGGWNCGKEYV